MNELRQSEPVPRRFDPWPDRRSEVGHLPEDRDRIAQLTHELEVRDARIAALLASTSWLITAPIRLTKRIVSGRSLGRIGRAGRNFVLDTISQGPLVSARRAGAALRRGLAWRKSPSALKAYSDPAAHPAEQVLAARVLIAAELSLQQCAKYRVHQKQMLIRLLGVDCTVIEWSRHAKIRNALQTHSIVIFYRVPGYQRALDNIAEAKRLGAVTIWEVDDLIFDEAAYRANRNVDRLEPGLKETVLNGVPLFRAALQACDYAIASTPALAASMRAAGARESFIIENGLDEETLELAGSILANRPARHDGRSVTLMYGSGSKAHNADFEIAGQGLLQVLLERADVRLRIVGELMLPEAFAVVVDQIERLPSVDYASYMRLLGEADISIAPLAPGLFNDSKSNIKFIEASILGIPSICSPRASFVSVIDNERNGLLADTPQQWADALRLLIDHPDRRLSMGEEARRFATVAYLPEVLAARQVRPFLQRFSPPRPERIRVIEVNLFFNPQSFGGATIVAEELAGRLHERAGMDVTVFTSWGDNAATPYDVVRFEAAGIPVIAVRLPDSIPPEMQFRNPRMGRIFADVLRSVRPDVVHFHSIQGLGADLAQACKSAEIPYVITLHDAWWICERQFMIRSDGHYCFQTRIEWPVCASCVPDLALSMRRFAYLRGVLDGAAKILTPSAFHRDLHVANGVAPDRIAVNRNGVRFPEPRRSPRPDPNIVRFGFVGGIGPVKGIDLIASAFQSVQETNYELVLVDNTLNLGFSSIHASAWRLPGQVHVVPAYTATGMDAFFNTIDVLLFPSQWKESFGLTVHEALVRDVWVIVTDAGGAVEDVMDGENGTIIPIGADPGPLREAITALLRDPGRLTGHVNRHAGRIATFDAQADELARILREVIPAVQIGDTSLVTTSE